MTKGARAQLVAAIAELPDTYRLVVESRLEGRCYAEIAASMGISPDSARQRFSRGLQELRERLGESLS